MPRKPSARGRVHIVLIPGFAGFDALGQLEYYAGVTPQFQLWKKSGASSRTGVALHYFDNFPTAAVRTRAARLRNYLATRFARGEFVRGDRIALVGHSTGGLDIRCLLLGAEQIAEANVSGRWRGRSEIHGHGRGYSETYQPDSFSVCPTMGYQHCGLGAQL